MIRYLFIPIAFFSFEVVAQSDLKTIVPPSPTVSALAKYGDTPVSYYTGTPSVSIPIYDVNTGDFSLPISLSYHASGVKVEEMSSWVGLGWSLNAGGIISRSIQGLQDEVGPGYLFTAGMVDSIAQLSAHEQEEIYRNWMAVPGSMDAEPDMFYFNFGSQSGKFFYNHSTGKFVSIPQSTLSFDKEYFLANRKWRIKAEDGTEYFFDLTEQNTSYSNCNGNASPATAVITGWFLTKIITPISRSQIIFNYELASYTTRNVGSQSIKAADIMQGLPECAGPALIVCESYNDYEGRRLKSIVYNKGKIEFKASTPRLDLIGDQQLDTIKVYNFREHLPSKLFYLAHDYFNHENINGTLSALDLSYVIRLKLAAVTEMDGLGNQLPPYVFEYDQSYPLPHRLSFNQDNWGYYNGLKGNQHLVPPYIDGAGLYISGADRTTDTTYNKIGILNKIRYPAGGSTLFNFESHKANGYIPYGQFNNNQTKIAYLDAADICTTASPDPYYCETLTIDSKKNGGAYVTITIDGISGCDYCANQTLCAVMNLGSTSFGLPITCNVTNVFVPNGQYTLTADFTHNYADPATYADFVIRVVWNEFLENTTGESAIGGLRIKSIVDDDGFGHQKSRFFNYEVNGMSSASMAADRPVYEYYQFCRTSGGSMQGSYTVRTSQSNLPMGTTQGSHIGYGLVEEMRDEIGGNGKSVYQYTTAGGFPDYVFGNSINPNSQLHLPAQYASFPFAPPTSMDHLRGLLIERDDFTKLNEEYVLVKKMQHFYDPVQSITPEQEPLFTETSGIKLGALLITDGSSFYDYPVFSHYKVRSDWVRLVKTVESQYDITGTTSFETTQSFEFDNPLHMQITRSRTWKSDKMELSTYYKYPLDFTAIPASAADSAVAGIKKLIESNFISSVIETIVTQKKSPAASEEVIDGTITGYRSAKPLPFEVHALAINSPRLFNDFTVAAINGTGNFVKDSGYQKKIEFSAFDGKGNILQQRKESDVVHSYQWGYNLIYPVAEVTNAAYQDFFYNGFEDDTLNVSSIARTGNKSHNGSLIVTLPGSGSKKLTYWKKTGTASWEFVETVISGTITIGATGTLIDEVRIYPAAAQMTTFTYQPGVGVATVTDSNNRVIYYEYDSFSRLKSIRDTNGNILKLFKYNYRNK